MTRPDHLPAPGSDPATWPFATGFFGPMIPPRLRPDGGLLYIQSLEPEAVRNAADVPFSVQEEIAKLLQAHCDQHKADLADFHDANR